MGLRNLWILGSHKDIHTTQLGKFITLEGPTRLEVPLTFPTYLWFLWQPFVRSFAFHKFIYALFTVICMEWGTGSRSTLSSSYIFDDDYTYMCIYTWNMCFHINHSLIIKTINWYSVLSHQSSFENDCVIWWCEVSYRMRR